MAILILSNGYFIKWLIANTLSSVAMLLQYWNVIFFSNFKMYIYNIKKLQCTAMITMLYTLKIEFFLIK